MRLSTLRRAGFAALVCCLPFAGALAEVPDIPELPEGWNIPSVAPVPGGAPTGIMAADIGGAWRYETSGHAVTSCDFPVWPLDPAAGILEVAPHADAVTVTLMSGGNCDPASMCIFEGSYDNGTLAVANRAVVDSEGGVAANGWAVVFTEVGRAEGIGSSAYVHPEGQSCNWSYTVILDRTGADTED